MSRNISKEIFRANREKIDRFMAYIKENAEKKSLDAAVHKMIFDIKMKRVMHRNFRILWK